MNWLEYDRCIKYINPQANYTIDGDLKVTWDFYHIGEKPSWEDCLAVLPEVQKDMHKKDKKEKALAKLEELDKKSIRAMREWLAGVEEHPGFIVEFEQDAQAARLDL